MSFFELDSNLLYNILNLLFRKPERESFAIGQNFGFTKNLSSIYAKTIQVQTNDFWSLSQY